LTFQAVAPAAHIPQWQSPSFDCESQLPWNSCLFNQMILETPRLILRPFREKDVERFAELMANHDFMRFSLGPYTHEQTQGVLQKFLSWDQAGLPSQFAVIFRKQ
jgi:RimJ/RimL family protein N-acetyltransferase